MTKNDAITTLGKWTDIKVTEQQSSDVASGEVISQNPAADETADPDQPIEIVVSSGNEAPASDTEDTSSATDNTASAQSTDSTQQSAAAANGEVWKCTQTLNTPNRISGRTGSTGTSSGCERRNTVFDHCGLQTDNIPIYTGCYRSSGSQRRYIICVRSSGWYDPAAGTVSTYFQESRVIHAG